MEDAKIGVMTHAFNYGTAVFEGIRGNWNADHEQLYLFKVRAHFERLEDAPVWDPSVEAWSMSEGDEVVGVVYLDMHPREGKYKHAAMFSPQTGVAGGALPIGVLLCNFPDPSRGDGRALMEHSQVLTFLHERWH